MRCEDVQTELMKTRISEELRQAMDSHLAVCDSCRKLQMLYFVLEDSLRRRVWTPPSSFVVSVAALAVAEAHTKRPNSGAGTSGFLVPHNVITGVAAHAAAALQGFGWTIRQYWRLLIPSANRG
jgi:hypothetical protein